MFVKCLKLLSNGCNIIGCYILRPFAHSVACCCVLLGVVVQSLTTVKLLSQQLSKFLLFCDRRSVAQQCWIRNIMHMAALPTLLRPRTRIKHGLLGVLQSLSLWSVSFLRRCTAGPNNVGSCCVRLHTTANTNATTHNIVGPIMFGLLRSFARSLSFLNTNLCTRKRYPFESRN